jgi:hypothetical protein
LRIFIWMNPLMIFGRALMLDRNRVCHIGLRELCDIAA